MCCGKLAKGQTVLPVLQIKSEQTRHWGCISGVSMTHLGFLGGLHDDVDHDAHQAEDQGLTLVHFPAQLQRFLLDRGCA